MELGRSFFAVCLYEAETAQLSACLIYKCIVLMMTVASYRLV